jgi:kynurenine formamidase
MMLCHHLKSTPQLNEANYCVRSSKAMLITVAINKENYQVDLSQPHCLAIPLYFNGAQPNHFGAQKARSKTVEVEGFIGDTERGGSCNVDEITLTPHCNGTHTESVGHIVNDDIAVAGVLTGALITSQLVTLSWERAKDSVDSYRPNIEDGDKLITRASLKDKLENINTSLLRAVIIRTLDNPKSKKEAVYNVENQPPFFSVEAMEYLVERGVEHILVDFPSVDKMYDEGLLANHHLFWGVNEGTYTLTATSQPHKTITEMIFVEDEIDDGSYLLNIQIPAFMSDAAPSRPVIYPMIKNDA